ncbi:MAG: CRISPR-associated helicase Cas3' [Sarcina sp.]
MLDESTLKAIQNECKNYNAKSINENKNVFEHNQDLDTVRKEIKEVFGLNEIMYRKLDLACQLHDIGKCVKFFQDNLETKNRTIRHEIYGASIKGLADNIKLAILTHHKDLDKLRENIVREEYKSEMEELRRKFNVEVEDISDFIDLCKTRKGKKLVANLDNIILKGLLNYCDHMASAGITSIDRGINTINEFKIPDGCKLNSIQREVIALKEEIDILIMAMTGLGKTATAMFWSDIVQNIDKSKRIYYILPHTASINSQYKDMNEMGLSVAMLHSKAEYFLGKYKYNFAKDDYKAFKKSTKQINICTIFQLVKAMFGCKRFEMLLAQMKNSIFIVDEIHCFDMKELSYILEMLKWLKENLGASVCIMSASIPTCLQEVIKERLGVTRIIIADKKGLKIRHKIHRVRKTILDDLDKIEKCLEEGKQVILCVNNVETAQDLYELFAHKYQTKLIHGRFTTRDREIAEQGLRENTLLIGTQAIEVSLNIDYGVMFTEIAPWDALLQRFGRVNRKGEKGIADIFIYDNIKTIYSEILIENTDYVISEVITKDESIILEEKVNCYLDKVYTEFDWKEYNKYIEYFELLIKGLKIGSYNSEDTEDMCGSDTISIVPKCLFEEFKDLIKQKKYLEAESLKVNIRKIKQFVDKNLFDYNTDYHVYVANYKYNSKTGLKFDEI